MLRVIATLASLIFGFQAALPLALACCSAPATSACCDKAKEREAASAPKLGKLTCCTAQPTARGSHKEEAIAASIRAPIAASNAVAMHLAIPLASRPLLSRTTLPVGVRPTGPPLPLRI